MADNEDKGAGDGAGAGDEGKQLEGRQVEQGDGGQSDKDGDQWPSEAKELIEKVRKEARDAEKRAKDAEKKAKAFEDRDLSDLQKLEKRAADAEALVARLERDARTKTHGEAVRSAAEKAGALEPSAIADLLASKFDADEIDAKALVTEAKTKYPSLFRAATKQSGDLGNRGENAAADTERALRAAFKRGV